MTCEPCLHCQNIVDEDDWSVGYFGYSCKVDSDWESGCGHPCKDFKPVLPSFYLENQLIEEQIAQQYIEDEIAFREAYEDEIL